MRPTAMQRLFHDDGERAIAAVAEEFGTLFGAASDCSACSVDSTVPAPPRRANEQVRR